MKTDCTLPVHGDFLCDKFPARAAVLKDTIKWTPVCACMYIHYHELLLRQYPRICLETESERTRLAGTENPGLQDQDAGVITAPPRYWLVISGAVDNASCQLGPTRILYAYGNTHCVSNAKVMAGYTQTTPCHKPIRDISTVLQVASHRQ